MGCKRISWDINVIGFRKMGGNVFPLSSHVFVECLRDHMKSLLNESFLVGCFYLPLKNMKVSWDYEIPKCMEKKTCSKTPTRF